MTRSFLDFQRRNDCLPQRYRGFCLPTSRQSHVPTYLSSRLEKRQFVELLNKRQFYHRDNFSLQRMLKL